ncbi:hypothetical protein [Streptomyces tailanensis]|nr:hypothetical protein [Streptomyces tailanensis]
MLGEQLITAGVLLTLFVVHSLWWTNVQADRQADGMGDRLRQE